MEYVCIGGASDGFRVNYTKPPPCIQLAEHPKFNFNNYDAKTDVPMTSTYVFSIYRLEELATQKKKFQFYLAEGVSVEEGLMMLLENYAIGDPTNKHNY